jgi:hypothetical protein
MSSKAISSRRNFIKALGLGGAAVVAAGALTKSEEKVDHSARSKGARDGKGYAATAHVRHYYRTARV